MSPIPVSLQLWSIRDHVKTDFAATMAHVARLGYHGVETAGYGNLTAADAAKAVADAGLRCSGMHVRIEAMRADLSQVLADAVLFGTTDIICPCFTWSLLKTTSHFIALGEELDALGARMRAYGFRLHYHNHAHEIARHDGRLGFDWLLDAARPANLGCEADVYWVLKGGYDPAAFLHEQGRRIELLHLKDDAELGTGGVDFAPIFKAIDTIGALRWQVVEIERYNHDPMESARISLEKLREWGRA